MQSVERLANDIVRLFEPSSVLHLGCEDASLITELTYLGVPSVGIALKEISLDEPDPIANRIFTVDILKHDVWFSNFDLVVITNLLEELEKQEIARVKEFIEAHGERFYAPIHSNHRIEWWQERMPLVFFEEVV